jgi:RNA polymerase sigma-70 factor (ECF subfamily)
MGGTKGSFGTTHWSDIAKAKTHDEERRRASVNNLVERYWKPVYCHLIDKGHSNEDAKDLVQGFFCEIVLGRELIQRADQEKGRFRTFLLTALDRYVTSVYRKETAKKRLPKRGLAQLDAICLPDMPIDKASAKPELAFNYAWATNLLDRVLARVKEEYCNTNRTVYWEVFRLKVLVPIFEDAETQSLEEICKKYAIESKKRPSNMMITVKRRFASVLRQELRRCVQSDSEVEDEFRALVEILSEGGAA